MDDTDIRSSSFAPEINFYSATLLAKGDKHRNPDQAASLTPQLGL